MKLTLVILVRRGLDNLNQAVETLENNLMRRRIVNLCGRGTGALGIDEGIGLGIADRLGKRERLLKSSSVSPGKPTIMSVESAISGIRLRMRSTRPK